MYKNTQNTADYLNYIRHLCVRKQTNARKCPKKIHSRKFDYRYARHETAESRAGKNGGKAALSASRELSSVTFTQYDTARQRCGGVYCVKNGLRGFYNDGNIPVFGKTPLGTVSANRWDIGSV